MVIDSIYTFCSEKTQSKWMKHKLDLDNYIAYNKIRLLKTTDIPQLLDNIVRINVNDGQFPPLNLNLAYIDLSFLPI